MNFEQFIDNIQIFLVNESTNSLQETIIKAEKFILTELINLKLKETTENSSINFEKIANIINYIEDIVEYFFKEKNLGNNKNIIENLFLNELNFDLLPNKLEEIKNKKKNESSYLIDSVNTIRDIKYNLTFEQYVHATANPDTDNGQGKLFFDINLMKHKNVYIIGDIIKKDYKGFLIEKKEGIDLFNLLPFFSMVSKITKNGSKKTIHENIYYFFKTAIIVIGNPIWENYNRNISKIYSKKLLEDYEWFYSVNYEENDKSTIIRNLSSFIKEYCIKLITLINVDNLKNKIQNNEKIILTQLYNLIKSIIFIENEDGYIDEYFINETIQILNLIENYDSEYQKLGLYSFSKENYIRIHNIFNIPNIHQNKTIQGLFYIINNKRDYEIYHLINEKLDSFNFILEMGKSLNLSSCFSNYMKKYKNKTLKEALNEKKFGNILKKEAFINKEETIKLLYDLFLFSFPTFFKTVKKNKYLLNHNKKIENIYLLFFLIIHFTEFNNNFINYLECRFLSGFCGTEHFYLFDIEDKEMQKIFFMSELLYPQNKLKFDDKNELKIKKTIYKYVTFYYWGEHSKKEIIDFNYNNHILEEEFKIKDKNIRENNDYFEAIMIIFNDEKYIPVEFAQLLINTLSSYVVIKFIEYLITIKDKSYLKESLLWFLSNRQLNMQIIN